MAWDREKEKKAGKAMTVGTSIFGAVFAVFWCVMAASMGAWFMLIFGIPFAGMMVYRLYVCLQLTKEEQPGKSVRDTDPWDRSVSSTPKSGSAENGYCPYCGAGIQEGFAFCPKCGRRLPE